MRWVYSFSGSEGGLGSPSSLHSVKGLGVLHSVVQQAFTGGDGPTHLCGWVHAWRVKVYARVGAACAFAQLLMCVCMWTRPFALPLAWQLDQAASVSLAVGLVVFTQWRYGFSGSEGGRWLPLCAARDQRAWWAAHGCAAGVQGRRRARVLRAARRVAGGGCQWPRCALVQRTACRGEGDDCARGVLPQRRRGQPWRLLLAAHAWKCSVTCSAGRCCLWAAGAQGRRRAHVVNGVRAARRAAHGVQAVGCGFSGGEGGLDGISSLRSLKGLRVLRLVTQQAFRGGGALACSMPLPCS